VALGFFFFAFLAAGLLAFFAVVVVVNVVVAAFCRFCFGGDSPAAAVIRGSFRFLPALLATLRFSLPVAATDTAATAATATTEAVVVLDCCGKKYVVEDVPTVASDGPSANGGGISVDGGGRGGSGGRAGMGCNATVQMGGE